MLMAKREESPACCSKLKHEESRRADSADLGVKDKRDMCHKRPDGQDDLYIWYICISISTHVGLQNQLCFI